MSKIGITALAVVVLGAGYWLFSDKGPELETLLVKADAFEQQVSTSGKVIPAQEVELGFTQSGRISGVNVRVGDRITAGSVLASIDSGDIRAQLLQKEAALDAQKAKLAALKQGTRPEEIAVAQADVTSDEAALFQSRAALVDSVRDAYVKTDDAIRNKVYQFVSNSRTNSPRLNFSSTDSQAVIDTEAAIIKVEAELTAWPEDLATMGAASDLSGYVARSQQRLSSAADLLAKTSRALNSSIPTSGASQSSLDDYEADVATARASVNTVTSALTTAVTAEKNAATALESSKRTLELKKAGTVQADIDAQTAQVKAAEAEVQNARSQLNKTYIVAPFSGIVTKVDAKVGKIVSPNTPEISLNSSAAFQIESFVPEVNIALVKVGDPATITLDAYGEDVPFTAKVVSIDPAETVKDGVATYRSLLQFDTNDSRIRSGMTANITITTAQKSDVVSIPQGLVVDRNGKKYVRILDADTVIEREVTTGSISSLGTIEILSGLSAGETLVVNETQ